LGGDIVRLQEGPHFIFILLVLSKRKARHNHPLSPRLSLSISSLTTEATSLLAPMPLDLMIVCHISPGGALTPVLGAYSPRLHPW
jgi:hypothetical protein